MRASDIARRLAVLACLLLLLAPLRAQDDGGDEDGDDPTLGQPGMPGGVGGIPLDPNEPGGGGNLGGDTGGNGNGGDGQPITVKRHQWTALQLLQWTWDHGYAPSREGDKPLAEKDAVLALAGHDERPMILLRECTSCARDDHKMLVKELGNDKTALYARWYHSVKLPADSLKPDSPFHEFFTARLPPHLLVATADGTVVGELGPRAKPAELWKLLSSGLKKTYRKDPDAAVKSLLAILDELDLCEKELGKLEDQLIKLKAVKDTPPRDLEKLEEKKKLLTDQRTALVDKARLLDDLQLRSATPAAPGG
jgi:hypothetical protein